MSKIPLGLGASLLLAAGALFPQQAGAQNGPRDPIVHPRLTKQLPDVPGKEVLVLDVEFPPGGVDPVHRHDAHGFVYVLEGEVEMGVKGAKPVKLRPGDTFYEGPDDIHTIGRNVSKTRRARFMVVLVKNTGANAVLPPK
jgi:quercetin dioxygenase-like cupin family protein